MTANIDTMAYVGATPWHKLGTKVDANAMTAEQAIHAGGLSWEVLKLPAFTEFSGTKIELPTKFITVRKDTLQGLGVVGSVYTILQNKSAFSFFDAVVGIKEAIYDTVGSLGKGERVWLSAKLNGLVKVTSDDTIEKYLLLSNSHDGTSPVQVMLTGVRTVCQNTLNLAIESATNKVSIRHTISMGSKVNEIQDALGLVNHKFQVMEELSRKLTTVKLTKKTFAEYLRSVGVIPKLSDDKEDSTRAENIMEQLSNLFENGTGAKLKSAKGTAWGAFNAVAEWVDYYRGTDQNRPNSLLFGSGAELKQKAWLTATSLL